MIGLGEIGSVAGEAAGRGEIAAAINRWHRMPVRYGDECVAASEEWRVGGDQDVRSPPHRIVVSHVRK